MKVTSFSAQTYLVSNKVDQDLAVKDSKTPEKLTDKSFFDEVTISQGAQLRVVQENLGVEIARELDSSLANLGLSLDTAGQMDWSPESVADRIFSFTTSFFGTYRAQNPELSDEEAINGFEELVRGATQRGYEQAMGALEGSEISEEVKPVAGETMEILMKKYDEYFNKLREQKAAADGQENVAADGNKLS